MDLFQKHLKQAVEDNNLFQKYLKLAVKDAESKLNLGLHQYGKEAGKDEPNVFQRLMNSAEGENTEAQYLLALCYNCGKGTSKDEARDFDGS